MARIQWRMRDQLGREVRGQIEELRRLGFEFRTTYIPIQHMKAR